MSNSWSYPGDVYELIRKYHRKIDLEIQFLESYGVKAKTSFLDLGCATGSVIRELSARGVNCTGVDSSSDFIRYANKNSNLKVSGNIRFDNSRIQDYQLNEDSYDFVSCVFNTISYLESYDEVEQLLCNVRSSLKGGGKFFLEFAFFLNFVGNFKDSMTINHFENDLKVTRLIHHSVNPHRAIWNHEETLLVQRTGKELETYFESQPQIVILPPVMERMLHKAGFEKVEFWGTWDKGRQVVGHSTCIAVAS